jgi:hypothetical protein
VAAAIAATARVHAPAAACANRKINNKTSETDIMTACEPPSLHFVILRA